MISTDEVFTTHFLTTFCAAVLNFLKNGIKMITIFYDGKCGLCSREINYYKKIAQVDKFQWLDIATDPAPLKSLKISQADGLRRLHGLDTAGRLHIGVYAFLLIWRELPYWRLLSMIGGLPGIRHLAQLVYNRFADYRFSRLAHCQIAANEAVLDHRK